MVDTLLVCMSGDVLVIGRKTTDHMTEVINAYEGDEARAVYEKLITREDKKNDTK